MLYSEKYFRFTLIVLITLIAFLSFYKLGSFTLFDVDEAVFAQATKEMVVNNDWITPTYNGENRYDKPILFYWMMAISYKIFGINEFGARFVSAFSGIILCIVLFFFSRKFSDTKLGIYSSLSMALSPFYFVYSHAAVTDMTLTLFITLSLFSFFLSLKINFRYIYGFYFFSALAFLTKGLIGILFPFGIALIYLLLSGQYKRIKTIFIFSGLLVFVVVALPWYIIEYKINGYEFIEQFFIKHHFKRYADVISGHKGEFYYYILVMVLGLFPWITFLPGSLTGIAKYIKEYFEFKNTNRKDDHDVKIFAVIWFLFILLFFTFSTTKLPNYILPAVPAACLLIGYGIRNENITLKKYINLTGGIISLVLAIACFFLKEYVENLISENTSWMIITGLFLFFYSLLSFFSYINGKTRFEIKALLIFLLVLFVLIKALPLFNQHIQGMLYKFSIYARENLKNNEKIILYNTSNPSIVFYSGMKVIHETRLKGLDYLQNKYGCIYVIAKTRSVKNLLNSGYTMIEKDNNYAIFKKGCDGNI
jgi:4-amino-4-deoxy-L-arabinose transferase-like glycosyltransferase